MFEDYERRAFVVETNNGVYRVPFDAIDYVDPFSFESFMALIPPASRFKNPHEYFELYVEVCRKGRLFSPKVLIQLLSMVMGDYGGSAIDANRIIDMFFEPTNEVNEALVVAIKYGKMRQESFFDFFRSYLWTKYI